jgi:hypothetical protein
MADIRNRKYRNYLCVLGGLSERSVLLQMTIYEE